MPLFIKTENIENLIEALQKLWESYLLTPILPFIKCAYSLRITYMQNQLVLNIEAKAVSGTNLPLCIFPVMSFFHHFIHFKKQTKSSPQLSYEISS